MAIQQFRLPLTGLPSRLVTGASGVDATCGVAGIGVAGEMIAGKQQSSNKGARFANVFTQRVSDPATGQARLYAVKRPGFGVFGTLASGQTGSALMVWSGFGTGTNPISAYGGTNSTIYNGTSTLGAITGVCTGISETLISNEAYLTIASSDNTAWYTSSTAVTGTTGFTGDIAGTTVVSNVSSTAGLLVGQLLTASGVPAASRIASIDSSSQITMTGTATSTATGVAFTRSVLAKVIDADFPGNASKTLVGDFAHMNGYAAIMSNDGVLWASELNSLSSWGATSFKATDSYPDKGVGCIRHRNLIMAFGRESLQFFYTTGETPFPFAVVENMTQKVGCVSANAIGRIGDTIFWVGSTPEGGLSVFQYDGSLSRASSPEVDAILLLAGASRVSLSTIRFYGYSFVLVRVHLATMAYCVETKTWGWWSSSPLLWYKTASVSVGQTMTTYALSNVSTAGKLYEMDHSAHVYRDDGFAYAATVQLDRLDHETPRMKFASELELLHDTEASSSPITLGFYDDDYNTFITWGSLDLANDRCIAHRLGTYSRRAYVLSHTANTPMRIEALAGTISVR
jgi:hypothetical protein